METLNVPMRRNVLFTTLLTIFAVFISAVVFGQDATKKIDIDINSNSGGSFLTSPWIWVVGIAIFVLLLVALLRGDGRRSA